jgi:hypothetical protein
MLLGVFSFISIIFILLPSLQLSPPYHIFISVSVMYLVEALTGKDTPSVAVTDEEAKGTCIWMALDT